MSSVGCRVSFASLPYNWVKRDWPISLFVGETGEKQFRWKTQLKSQTSHSVNVCLKMPWIYLSSVETVETFKQAILNLLDGTHPTILS